MAARAKSRNPKQIRQDFLDAIERLQLGKPQHPELRARAEKKKPVRINVANVAKEAGRARSLIARENCDYPDIRYRIRVQEGAVRDTPRNSDDVIADLRARIAELQTELKLVKERVAHHQEQRQRAEQVAIQQKYAAQRANQENQQLKRKLIEVQRGRQVVSITGNEDDAIDE